MLYTIYKITNTINHKYYIGMHKTKKLDDGYMGSGKLIRRAIEKYGVDNFTKEILYIFDNEDDMRNKEKELVILGEMCYNLCDGGLGGFGYLNRQTDKSKWTKKGRASADAVIKEKYGVDNPSQIQHVRTQNSIRTKLNHAQGKMKAPPSWLGKTHTEETKQKMSKPKNQGSKNSQFGTSWITDGKENKKIKKEHLDKFIELGYYKGRIAL